MKRPKALGVLEAYKAMLGLMGFSLAWAIGAPLGLFIFLPVLFVLLGWLIYWGFYEFMEIL